MVTTESIKTFVRVRPLHSHNEISDPSISVPSDTTIAAGNMMFSFDKVFDAQSTQQLVFETVAKPLCDHALNGYNVSLFCYGQTGTGKTWTMQGPSYEDGTLSHNETDNGIIQRTFDYLFNAQKTKMSEEECFESTIQIASYVEIYNELIFDLMDSSGATLQIREDAKKGIFVHGAVEREVKCYEDAYRILEEGTRNRTTAETGMNRCSSRSHSIMTIILQNKITRGALTEYKESRMNLIDLAGSERQKLTSTTGVRLKEGGHINRSLLVLGTCIDALVDISHGKSRHVHYRDSKLTMLLKDSLGGNSKSAMVATMSPSTSSLSETLSTLRFASRAKLVLNRAEMNQSVEASNLSLLQQEIIELKRQLAERPPIIQQVTAETLDVNLYKLAVNQCTELEKKLQEAVQQVNQLKELNSKRESQTNNLKMILKMKESQIERIKRNDSCDNVELQELRKELDLARNISEQNPMVLEYASQVLHLQSKLRDYLEKDEFYRRIGEEKRLMEDLQQHWNLQNVACGEKIEKLQERIQNLLSGDAYAPLTLEISQLNQENLLLKTANGHLTETVKELEARVSQLTEMTAKQASEIELWTSNAHVQALTLSLQNQTSELESLQEKHSLLIYEKENFAAQLAAREGDWLQDQKKLEDMQALNDILSLEKEQWTADCWAAQQEVQELKKTLDEQQIQLCNLTQDRNYLKSSLDTLMRESGQNKSMREIELMQNLNQIKNERDEVLVRAEKLANDLACLNDAVLQKDGLLQQALKEQEALEKQLTESKFESENLKMELEDMGERLVDMIQETSQNETADAYVQFSEESLNAKATESVEVAVQSELFYESEPTSEAADALENYQLEIHHLQEAIKTKDKQMEDLKAENEKLVSLSNHKQKVQYVVNLKRENNSLKRENDALKRSLQKYDNDHEPHKKPKLDKENILLD